MSHNIMCVHYLGRAVSLPTYEKQG